MKRLLAGVVVLALVLLLPFLGYLTDDSYIHFQFAKNLLRGDGFAFNAGDPTYGATSPLWVLLLAAAGIVVPGASGTPDTTATMPALAWIAKGWGALFTALSVIWLARLARRLGWEPRLAVAAAFLAAVHPWATRWAISGMETPLALFAAVAALDALAAALIEGAPAWRAGAWIAVAALTRPECLLLALLGAIALAIGGESRLRARSVALLGAGFVVPYGAWLAFAWTQFHRLMPNTSAAKAGAWLDLERGAVAVRDGIRIVLASEATPVLLAVLVLAFGGVERLRGMERGRRAFWILVALWPVLLLLFYAATGVQVVSRYLIPATPAVLLLGVASWRVVAAQRSVRPNVAAAGLVVFLAIHAAEGGAITFRVSAPSAREHAVGLRESLGEIGRWAAHETPPGTLFAVSDIGAFAFYSDRPVLDLFGLVTPGMASVASRVGYDRVVLDVRFEAVGRPAYLVDRARQKARLTSTREPDNPYRFLFARSIENLGITRPGGWFYSVYSIDWEAYDRLHPRFASR